jgi:tRNA(His) guanylyltransferase
MSDSLGDRMKKNYEDIFRHFLTRRIPVIIRLDGKAFHTLTAKMHKPYDDDLRNMMVETMKCLCEEVQGCKAGYHQSDEISLLLTDFDELTTDAWFGYNIQKMVSVSASIATAEFNSMFSIYKDKDRISTPIFAFSDQAMFDSRCFNIPKEEVFNYFLWRQKDWERNSLSMLAQSLYSHKELHRKRRDEQHEMIHQKGHNWTTLEEHWKEGTFYTRESDGWKVSSPLLIDNKSFFDKWIYPSEEKDDNYMPYESEHHSFEKEEKEFNPLL